MWSFSLGLYQTIYNLWNWRSTWAVLSLPKPWPALLAFCLSTLQACLLHDFSRTIIHYTRNQVQAHISTLDKAGLGPNKPADSNFVNNEKHFIKCQWPGQELEPQKSTQTRLRATHEQNTACVNTHNVLQSHEQARNVVA